MGRRIVGLFALAAIATGIAARPLRAQQRAVGADSGRYMVHGVVRDARSDSTLPGVRITTSWSDVIGVPHSPVTTDSAGRFLLTLDRRGPLVLSLRRLGYQPDSVALTISRDTTPLLVRLSPLAQQLPTVTVTERAVALFVDSVRTELRAVNHVRFFDAAALAHSKQTLAGAFLFGQAGMQRTPCRRSAQFLPEGTRRTVPVEDEPADLWFPCVLARGKPQSVLVRIDGGEPQPFATISQRELADFAAIAVISGRMVIAYTKGYAATHAPR